MLEEGSSSMLTWLCLQAGAEESWATHETQANSFGALYKVKMPSRLRFQESSMDEVSFLGEHLVALFCCRQKGKQG